MTPHYRPYIRINPVIMMVMMTTRETVTAGPGIASCCSLNRVALPVMAKLTLVYHPTVL